MGDRKEFLRRMQQIYISKRLVRILRVQYQRATEEELENLDKKKNLRNPNLLNSKEVVACKINWPVCINVLEQSKQKKRNTSTFSFKVNKIKCAKPNFYSLNSRHTHVQNLTYSRLKKKAKDRERGREKRRVEPTGNDQSQLFVLGSEGIAEDKSKIVLNVDKGTDKEKVEPKLSDDLNETIKYSEDPLVVQNNLLIGRHEHTCRESLTTNKQPSSTIKRKQSPVTQVKKIVVMEEFVKSSLDELRDSKSPIYNRNLANRVPERTEFKPASTVHNSFAAPKQQ